MVLTEVALGVRLTALFVMPATDRIDEKAWDRYETHKERNDAYSRMHLSSCKHATRMALVSGCQSATIFFPLSGEIQTFSTMGTFVEAVALFDSVDAYYELSVERLKMDYADVWDDFAADMPWVDGVIERLAALGVRQATLDRFDAAYRRRALSFSRGQHNIARDFASALEDGIEQWIASVDGTTALPSTAATGAVGSTGGGGGESAVAGARVPPTPSATPVARATPVAATTVTGAPTPTAPPPPPSGLNLVTPMSIIPPAALGFARPPSHPSFVAQLPQQAQQQPLGGLGRAALEALTRDAIANYALRGRGGVPRRRPQGRGAGPGSRGGF